MSPTIVWNISTSVSLLPTTIVVWNILRYPLSISSVVRTTANGILIIFQLTNASGSGCCCISRTTAGDVIKTWNTGWQRLWRYAYSVTDIKSWRFSTYASCIYLHSFRVKVNFTQHEFWQLRLYIVKRANNCSTYSNWSDFNPPCVISESFFILI